MPNHKIHHYDSFVNENNNPVENSLSCYNENKCKTKYPIVLIHGTGFRDRKIFCYWGRIPKVLISYGASIFYGHQDSWATIENNASVIKNSIERVLKETGAEKVNLISHSKGGLEARYVISTLHMSNQVASLTAIAAPHHGSKTMDRIYKLPKVLFEIVSVFVNLWFRSLGDTKPDFHNVCKSFTTSYAQEFNKNNPDMDGVYYQSYAAVMKNSFSDFFMSIPHFVINLIEGENDGLVPLYSAKWTNFKGVLASGTNRGISHADEVDIRRMRLSKKTRLGIDDVSNGTETIGNVNDICDFYVKIVSDLKNMGY